MATISSVILPPGTTVPRNLHFADRSHVVFYARASRGSRKQVAVTCRSGGSSSRFEMAVADDQSVQDVIRQLEDLQRRVRAKKQEVKQMKKQQLMQKKAKNKMSSSSSSSSSESSDSSEDECTAKNLVCRKVTASVATLTPSIDTVVIDTVVTETKSKAAADLTEFPTPCATVEICTGGKCKKNGSVQVLNAFLNKTPNSSVIAASSCKCLGMCKEGPNVRLQKGDSTPVVYNGVTVEDVDPLLQQLFQLGLACPILPC